MLKQISIASALASAMVFGAMPTASAQTEAETEGTPYAITINGSHYPANLETIGYPFTAASLNRDGECLLNVMTDEAGQIAAITILSCTDDLFRGEAESLIKLQPAVSATSSNLKVHALQITWDIGETAKQAPIQLAVR